MNVSCPECGVVYRIDAAKLPGAGARTRCRECEASFHIARDPDMDRAGHVVEGRRVATMASVATGQDSGAAVEPVPEADAQAPDAAPVAPAFGPQDPHTRARRLARALVSDIKVYNRDRWSRSREDGTLRKDFREEILKSWDEYVEQVGEEMAKRTPYFRDALNDILAEGEKVF